MKNKKTKEKPPKTWYSDRMDEITRQLWAGEFPLGRWEKRVTKAYEQREQMTPESWGSCKVPVMHETNLPEPWVAYETVNADELLIDDYWRGLMSAIFGYIAAKQTGREYKAYRSGKKITIPAPLTPIAYRLTTRSPDGIHPTLDRLTTKAAFKIMGDYTMVKWEGGGPEFRVNTDSHEVYLAMAGGETITREQYETFGKETFKFENKDKPGQGNWKGVRTKRGIAFRFKGKRVNHKEPLK